MLDGEQVVRAAPGQVVSMAALGVKCVGSDDRAGDVDAVQQGREHRDLVRLRADLYLAQHGTMGVIQRGQQMIAGSGVAGRTA